MPMRAGKSTAACQLIYAWVRANGAYAGITVEGTSVSFNLDEGRSFYGKTLNVEEIVLRGEAVNHGADALRNVLATR